MGKFTGGLVAGSILGAVGLGCYALSDRRTRKRMIKDTQRAAHKAGDVIDNVTSMF